MKTLRKIVQGQYGAKKLVEQYGENFVSVRYKYDEELQIAIKTVEIIVEKRPWHKNAKKIPMNKLMRVKLDYSDEKLRKQVMAAGGKWINSEKLWKLSYKQALALGIMDKVVS
jgi:hypothetical protein